ncbi:unnamed protein product [Rotaria socialis]
MQTTPDAKNILHDGPRLFFATFPIDNQQLIGDTYLNLDFNWSKGVAFCNGFNLGRYWNVGPQRTLYIPAQLLVKGVNQIQIFEFDKFLISCTFALFKDYFYSFKIESNLIFSFGQYLTVSNLVTISTSADSLTIYVEDLNEKTLFAARHIYNLKLGSSLRSIDPKIFVLLSRQLHHLDLSDISISQMKSDSRCHLNKYRYS